jgi:hypothetical protein
MLQLACVFPYQNYIDQSMSYPLLIIRNIFSVYVVFLLRQVFKSYSFPISARNSYFSSWLFSKQHLSLMHAPIPVNKIKSLSNCRVSREKVAGRKSLKNVF